MFVNETGFFMAFRIFYIQLMCFYWDKYVILQKI